MTAQEAIEAIRRAVTASVRGPDTGRGRVGVACSGGADSMVLADAAIGVFGASRVVVMHVDHQLRQGSGDDGAAVAAWAATKGAAWVVRQVVVAQGASLEAQARRARYRALDELAEEHGIACVLTAHTARDQAETMLMRIVRGTGPAGLRGIRRRWGRFRRPLLAITSQQIAAYAATRRLPVRHDPMNDDPRFLRVRIRSQLLPMLRRENPRIEAALGQLARSAAEWRRAIDGAARRLDGLDASTLASAPPAVGKRALARAARRRGLALSARHLDQILALCRESTDGTRSIDLPGGKAVRRYQTLAFELSGTSKATAAPTISGPDAPYDLRQWQAGDRMRPARLGGRSRKLSDLFIDAKVPRDLRKTAWVAVRRRDLAIVWAEHLGPSFDGNVEASVPRRRMGNPR